MRLKIEELSDFIIRCGYFEGKPLDFKVPQFLNRSILSTVLRK